MNLSGFIGTLRALKNKDAEYFKNQDQVCAPRDIVRFLSQLETTGLVATTIKARGITVTVDHQELGQIQWKRHQSEKHIRCVAMEDKTILLMKTSFKAVWHIPVWWEEEAELVATALEQADKQSEIREKHYAQSL